MPEMDGMTATQKIRELLPPKSNIPIIALTAHTLSGDKERFLAAGMNDYLTKPINRVATLSCIAQWTNSETVPSENTTVKETSIEDIEQYVNEKVLLQLVEDTDVNIVPELIKLYIEDTQQRLVVINTSINKQDIEALEFQTHTVGSSAVAHGNEKLYLLSRKIELLCRKQQHQEALTLAIQLTAVAEKSFELLSNRAKKGFLETI